MILSVSRRTDIPAYYAEWFMNRLRESFVLVRNPMNYHQISRVSLAPELIDCIVFWTKDAEPLLPYIEEINARYPFYVQFTLNDYDADIEVHVPPREQRLHTFRALSDKIGKERVIWRYDPILLSPKYTVEWHIEHFRTLASALYGYTNTCVFSFVDLYDKVRGNVKGAEIRACTDEAMLQIAAQFSTIARAQQITLQTCAEEINLEQYGIKHGSCIESIDIGQYNTCRHGCKYCYANFNAGSVRTFCEMHSDTSPLLIGQVEPEDKITPRRNMKSLKQSKPDAEQITMTF